MWAIASGRPSGVLLLLVSVLGDLFGLLGDGRFLSFNLNGLFGELRFLGFNLNSLGYRPVGRRLNDRPRP